MSEQAAGRHVPVLLHESISFLRVRPAGTYVDCTLGFGGHAEAILRQLGPSGRLVGFDRDPEAMAFAKDRLVRVCEELGSQAPEVMFIGEAFSSIEQHLEPSAV